MILLHVIEAALLDSERTVNILRFRIDLVCLGHGIFSVLLHLLCRWPAANSLPPRPVCWQVFLHLLLKVWSHKEWDQPVPWDERQIGIGELLANDILLSSRLEMSVHNSHDALDLFAIAIHCGFYLFGVFVM